MSKTFILRAVTALIGFSISHLALASAPKEVTFLFIGNSYTYLPGIGSPEDPGLPKMIKAIAESIDKKEQIKFWWSTPGGWTVEKHYSDADNVWLMSHHYDHVVLQGSSLDSLELTPWHEEHGQSGVKSFAVYLPKTLDLVFQNNTDVNLYVTWGYGSKNGLLAEGHPGLYFPPGTPRAGQKWCGKDKFEYQSLIDDSYALHSMGYPVSLIHVGDAWVAAQTARLIQPDDLYISDGSHASARGAFISALVMTRDILHLDITKNKFFPVGVDTKWAKKIEKFLKHVQPKCGMHCESQKSQG